MLPCRASDSMNTRWRRRRRERIRVRGNAGASTAERLDFIQLYGYVLFGRLSPTMRATGTLPDPSHSRSGPDVTLTTRIFLHLCGGAFVLAAASAPARAEITVGVV